jgi:UDP-N-acetyl-D-glucosamine dehydrogenase
MNRTDVVVTGLGFTGLPLAVAAARVGLHVRGVDTASERVSQIKQGNMPPGMGAVAENELRVLLNSEHLQVQDSGEVPHAKVFSLSVPTPSDGTGRIDTSILIRASGTVGKALQPGSLVLVHSTCAPGTIERRIVPVLARKSGLLPGIDFHVAHAPERIDPGLTAPGDVTVARVVAGLTPQCTKSAISYLQTIYDRVVPVGSLRTAEFVKTFENTFRMVNISLANELASVCLAEGVDPAEVIDAASTKPYGFLPHRPGIGAGGGCVPVVAEFFRSSARHRGMVPPVVEAALAVNAAMPGRTIEELRRILDRPGRPSLRGCRVLVVGVTYKPDVADIRNSSAVRVVEQLRTEAAVTYHDPYIPRLRLSRGTVLRSVPAEQLGQEDADVALILTRHSTVDHDRLPRGRRLVVDCSSGTPVELPGT